MRDLRHWWYKNRLEKAQESLYSSYIIYSTGIEEFTMSANVQTVTLAFDLLDENGRQKRPREAGEAASVQEEHDRARVALDVNAELVLLGRFDALDSVEVVGPWKNGIVFLVLESGSSTAGRTAGRAARVLGRRRRRRYARWQIAQQRAIEHELLV